MTAPIELTVFNDPGCPWGYSAIPALRTLEWRYGDQLSWRLVVIGLTESAQQYLDRGYTPIRAAQGLVGFRRYGMPLSPEPRARISATAAACRAIVAARLQHPGSEWRVLRALQLAHFTTPLVLEDVEQLRAVLRAAPGIDGDTVIDALDDPAVTAAYEQDRAEARTAAGTPGALQRKTANSDGAERYTAPSVVLRRGETRLEATGFQPIEAYDVLVANLDPTLQRREAASSVRDVLDALTNSAHGPDATTQEVAAIMAAGNDRPDRDRAERELLALVADGEAVRNARGDDACWRLA